MSLPGQGAFLCDFVEESIQSVRAYLVQLILFPNSPAPSARAFSALASAHST